MHKYKSAKHLKFFRIQNHKNLKNLTCPCQAFILGFCGAQALQKSDLFDQKARFNYISQILTIF